MPSTPDIRVRLTAEGLQEVIDSLKRVREESRKAGEGGAAGFASFGKSLGGVKKLLGALGLAVGVVEITRAISDLLRTTSELAQNLQDAGEEFGGNSASAVALAAALHVTETESGKATAGIKALVTAVNDLNAGKVTDQTAALRQLGLTARDFRGKDLGAQFITAATALAQYSGGLGKATLASDLFGKKVGLELIPLINFLGGPGLAAVRKQLEQLFTPQAIANVAEMRQSLKVLEFQVQGIALQFLSGLAPAITAVSQSIARDLSGEGGRSIEEFGRNVGRWVGLAILALEAFVDEAITATRAVFNIAKAAALLATVPEFKGKEIIRDLKEVVALADKFEERASNRQDVGRAILNGKLPQAEVSRDVVGEASSAVSEASKAMIERAKAIADAQLALVRERIRAAEAEAKSAFDRGLISIREYYAERRRLQQASFDAEAKAIRDQAGLELSQLESRLTREKAARDAAVRSIESEQRASAAGVPIARPVTETDVKQARDAAAVADKAAQAELLAAREDFGRRTLEINARIGAAQVKNETELLGLTADEAKAVEAVGVQRIAIENRLAALRGDHHAQQVAQDDEEIRKARELVTQLGDARPAGLVGPLQLNQQQQALEDLTAKLEAAQRAARDFGSALEDSQRELTDLDARRAAVQDEIGAGLKSQVAGNAELLRLDEQRIERLRGLAAMLREMAADNPDFGKQADDFERQARVVELRVQAATDVTRSFKAASQDAATSGLVQFLSRGVGEANGFRDALLGVVDALRQFVAQALATRLLGGLFGGTKATASGGGGFTPRLEQFRFARGGHVRGYARGGFIRGPGTSTSDSIATRVPAGSFVIRAAAVRIPTVRRILDSYHQVGATVVRALGGEPSIPVRLSNGEYVVPPEIVRRPGMLRELEAINRGTITPRLTARAMGFAGGGLVAGDFSRDVRIAGAAGASGADGQAGANGETRVTVGLQPGLIAQHVEEFFRGPNGPRVVVTAAAKAPRAMRAATGRG